MNELSEINRQCIYFESIIDELKDNINFKDKAVGIHDFDVVDSDVNIHSLSERMLKNYEIGSFIIKVVN